MFSPVKVPPDGTDPSFLGRKPRVLSIRRWGETIKVTTKKPLQVLVLKGLNEHSLINILQDICDFSLYSYELYSLEDTLNMEFYLIVFTLLLYSITYF